MLRPCQDDNVLGRRSIPREAFFFAHPLSGNGTIRLWLCSKRVCRQGEGLCAAENCARRLVFILGLPPKGWLQQPWK